MHDKYNANPRTNVLGVGVSSINMDEAVELLLEARRNGESGYVCVTGVHGVIESQRDPELKNIHNRSFLTVPDGMPTVWMGREQGFTKMGRVYGPDLMLKVFEKTSALGAGHWASAAQAIVDKDSGSGYLASGDKHKTRRPSLDAKAWSDSAYAYPSQEETGALDLGEADNRQSTIGNRQCMTHFLYGSTPDVLEKLKANLEQRFPGVRIVGTYAPPFRPLNEEEEHELQQIVSACKPDFFWVGLSTPKQEKFMAEHAPPALGLGRQAAGNKNDASSLCQTPDARCPRPLEAGIMLGVGAAFPIHAGLQKDAPEWIKNSGLQWLHRLCQEPRRLWRRYLDIVPTFLWLAFLQLLGIKKYSIGDGGQQATGDR